MAAQVKNNGENSEITITRDLLAGLSNKLGHNHFDPDLHIPTAPEIPPHFKAYNPGLSNEKMKEEEEMKEERSVVELKVVSSSSQISVCTDLDKVKCALERVENESMMRREKRHMNEDDNNCGMFAAACPCCFMYVITFNNNPICPRCNSTVIPSSFSFHTNKKLRFDLNASF